MQTLAILLLAAGKSTRMNGRDKAMENVNGRPILAEITARALATGAQTFVTLPCPDHPRALLIAKTAACPVFVTDAATGMAASFRAAVSALPKSASAMMIVPTDMPDLLTEDFNRLITAFDDDITAPIIRATTDNAIPGHPVILPRWLFSEIATLAGDQGASPLLKAHANRIRFVVLGGQRATTDLDTPQDWANWRTKA